MRQNQFQTSFYFLEKLKMREKQGVCSLVSTYFNSTQHDIKYMQNVQNFRLLIQRYAKI